MGAIKKYLHDWLENFGYELGYDMANVPDLQDLDWVTNDDVDAEAYWKQRKEEDDE